MGWLENSVNFIGGKAASVAGAIDQVRSDIIGEANELRLAPFSYATDSLSNTWQGLKQIAKDASTADPKAILKATGNVVGFIPLVGDAAEIICHGAAAGVGICQNGGNWKGELAEFAGEAAIAALPGPNIIGAARLVGKAGKAVAGQVADKGVKSVVNVAKDTAEIALKAPANVATNLAKEAAKNPLEAAGHVILPGAGTAIAKTTAHGVSDVKKLLNGEGFKNVSQQVAQRHHEASEKLGKFVTDSLPDNALAKSFTDARVRSIDYVTDHIKKVEAKLPKLSALAREAGDELWTENIILEPLLATSYEKYVADATSNRGIEGELVTINASVEEDNFRLNKFAGSPVRALAAHGIMLPEGVEDESVLPKSPEEFFNANAEKVKAELVKFIQDPEFAQDNDAMKAKFVNNQAEQIAKRLVNEATVTGQKVTETSYLGYVTTKINHTVLFDLDKREPIKPEDAKNYTHYMNIDADEIVRQANQQQRDKAQVSAINEESSAFELLIAGELLKLQENQQASQETYNTVTKPQYLQSTLDSTGAKIV